MSFSNPFVKTDVMHYRPMLAVVTAAVAMTAAQQCLRPCRGWVGCPVLISPSWLRQKQNSPTSTDEPLHTGQDRERQAERARARARVCVSGGCPRPLQDISFHFIMLVSCSVHSLRTAPGAPCPPLRGGHISAGLLFWKGLGLDMKLQLVIYARKKKKGNK